MKKIWVLAEQEAFYLPPLVARLARGGALNGVIEIRFKSSVSSKLRNLARLMSAFGLKTFLLVSFMSAIATLLDKLSGEKYFSLSKVARKYQIPYFKCEGFDDPVLLEMFENKIGDDPVFVQVGKKVPKFITDKYFLLNKHCSLLPKYAGVMPVFWAMLRREEYQGVTIHKMNEEYDKGRIISQARVENSGDLFNIYSRLYAITGDLLLELLGSDKNLRDVGYEPDAGNYSFFSYPKASERKQFIRSGFKYGMPLRLTQTVRGGNGAGHDSGCD